MENKGITVKGLLVFILLIFGIFLIFRIAIKISENSKKDTNLSAANEFLNAAKLYYTESLLDSSKIGVNGKTNLIALIKVNGKRPDGGELYITSNGTIAAALLYDKICYKKNFSDANLIEADSNNCTLGIK